jgi:hypothetical protein
MLGQCPAFAIAANEVSGWPMYKVKQQLSGMVVHVVVKTPEGDFLHARGRISEAGLASEYGENGTPALVEPLTERELFQLVNSPTVESFFLRPLVEIARTVMPQAFRAARFETQAEHAEQLLYAARTFVPVDFGRAPVSKDPVDWTRASRIEPISHLPSAADSTQRPTTAMDFPPGM